MLFVGKQFLVVTRHFFPRDSSPAWRQNICVSGCGVWGWDTTLSVWGFGTGLGVCVGVQTTDFQAPSRHLESASRGGTRNPICKQLTAARSAASAHWAVCIPGKSWPRLGPPSCYRAQLSRSWGLNPRLPDSSAWCLQRLDLYQRGSRPLCKHRCLTHPWQELFCHQFFRNEKLVFIRMKY